MTINSMIRFAAMGAMTAAAAFSSNMGVENAKVPFAFRAGGMDMPAGTYSVERQIGRTTPIFVVRNVETGKSGAVMTPLMVAPDATLEGQQARLVFECAGTECALVEVQPGVGRDGYRVLGVKFRSDYGANKAAKPEVARVAITTGVTD
jgi:hypothetical protein